MRLQIAEAASCAPSLLVLHDLHLLCPEESSAGEPASNPHSQAITDWLCDVMGQLQQRRPEAPPWPGKTQGPDKRQ